MKILVLLLTILFSSATLSNVIITGTRIIYPADADSIAVQLTNNSKTSSLVQSWIDNGDENSTPENSEAPFYLSPPIVKIEGLQGQQLKIKKIPGKLPENVESVFFLNVLDIPKTPESAKGKNAIQLATRSRIKIFYRPIGLTESPDEVINNASYQIKNNKILVKNNSQYHLTIAA
ncbi:fimbrial biogenesis chaperone, partial [Providencia rettgeri]